MTSSNQSSQPWPWPVSGESLSIMVSASGGVCRLFLTGAVSFLAFKFDFFHLTDCVLSTERRSTLIGATELPVVCTYVQEMLRNEHIFSCQPSYLAFYSL